MVRQTDGLRSLALSPGQITDTLVCSQDNRQADKLTGKQAGRQIDRQADRQIDGQTDVRSDTLLTTCV
jgi:hypothetical protein